MKKKIIIISVILVCSCIGIFLLFSLFTKKENKPSATTTITTTKDYDTRIKELLEDAKEIERKWLIDKNKIPYDLTSKDVQVFDIQQTYISFDPEIRVRNYNNGGWYEFTMKTNMTSDGLARDEVNYYINKEQYDNLYKKKEGNTIHKTRYQLYDKGEIIALDIFHDDLDGLAYMEIEFKTEEESNKYKEPDWVIKDVTSDKRYKNGFLARYGIPEN